MAKHNKQRVHYNIPVELKQAMYHEFMSGTKKSELSEKYGYPIVAIASAIGTVSSKIIPKDTGFFDFRIHNVSPVNFY